VTSCACPEWNPPSTRFGCSPRTAKRLEHNRSASSECSAPAIPAADAAKKNPGKPTSEGLAEAKRLHGYHCAHYHGTEGDGKGDLAVQKKLHLKDWRNPDTLAKLADGQLFPIITNGRRRSRFVVLTVPSPLADFRRPPRVGRPIDLPSGDGVLGFLRA
jgi:hypothetical protein